MTPYELNMQVEVFLEKKLHEEKMSIYQAYLISRWVWQKKIDIKKILSFNSKKTMTDEMMLEQVKILNAVFGGNTR